MGSGWVLFPFEKGVADRRSDGVFNGQRVAKPLNHIFINEPRGSHSGIFFMVAKKNRYNKKYMQLAIKLARRGAGMVSPNPMVGCVIVKNDKIISTVYHKYFGGQHAEIGALKKCNPSTLARGATMYVNLEPCCHHNKKTPPCVPQIIDSGVKEVIIAMRDPNPAVSGNGIKQLRENNIICNVGVLKDEAEELNEAYIKYIKTKMPFVVLKMAYSMDGKAKTETGDSKWISSEKSREIPQKACD